MLKRALEIAVAAHNGQKCPYGEQYILHPLRVMGSGVNECEQIVGVLHDVVEDTSIILDDLAAAGLSEEVVKAVELLTRSENQSYDDYIENIARCGIRVVVAVKLYDLQDNINPLRLPYIEEREIERIKKYHKAYKRLKPVFDKL